MILEFTSLADITGKPKFLFRFAIESAFEGNIDYEIASYYQIIELMDMYSLSLKD